MLLALFIGSQAGCKKSDSGSDPITGYSIIGKWSKTISSQKLILQFNNSGKFDAGTQDTIYPNYGTFSTSGNEFSIIDISQLSSCGSTIGKYTFTVTSNTLIFVLKSDSCTARTLTLVGTWNKE